MLPTVQWFGYFFVGVLCLVVLAFTPTYVTELPGDFDIYTHVHAALMVTWFALAIAQPFLIRGERRRLHRALGKLSYGLVPAIAVVTVLLIHARVSALPDAVLDEIAFFFFLPLSMMLLFVVAYVLAIVYRKRTALHARYMACTCLGVADPVLGRILERHFPPLPDPRYAQVVSFCACAGALLVMIVVERHRRAGRAAYPVMLAVTTAVFALFFTFAQTAAWRDCLHWFRDRALT